MIHIYNKFKTYIISKLAYHRISTFKTPQSIMPQISIAYYLLLSAALFSIGLALIIVKRHAIVVLMGIELMLNAVNLNLVAFSRNDATIQGQFFALFVIVVAAAEAVVALAIILRAYRYFKTVNLDEISKIGD